MVAKRRSIMGIKKDIASKASKPLTTKMSLAKPKNISTKRTMKETMSSTTANKVHSDKTQLHHSKVVMPTVNSTQGKARKRDIMTKSITLGTATPEKVVSVRKNTQELGKYTG